MNAEKMILQDHDEWIFLCSRLHGLDPVIREHTSGSKMLQMLFVSLFTIINTGPVYQSWVHFDNELMPDELAGHTVLVSSDLLV